MSIYEIAPISDAYFIHLNIIYIYDFTSYVHIFHICYMCVRALGASRKTAVEFPRHLGGRGGSCTLSGGDAISPQRCHFQAYSSPLLSPIRQDRQVNKCVWKTSSSRRYGRPPEHVSARTRKHTHRRSFLGRCRLEQTSINNLEALRLLSRNLCSVKRWLIE